MIERDLLPDDKTVRLLPKDRHAAGWICNYVIVQCVVVFIGASTVMQCLWSPEHATQDYDKLARIMYLFDSKACGYNLRASRAITNLWISNATNGYNVLPIKHIEISIAFHVIWLVVTIMFRLMRDIQNVRFLKLALAVFFYTSVSMVLFDLSMGIVYIAHIQQSLTKGMILRYSGWSVEMKLKNDEGFGGWLPIAAAICWMRGIIFLGINIYCCRRIRLMRRRIKKREVKTKLMLEENPPIPEATYRQPSDDKVLYFRTGEKTFFIRKSYRSLFFD